MVNTLKQLVMEEEGQGMTEYGLIIGLIALAAIAGMTVFGEQLDAAFQSIKNQLAGATGTTPIATP